MRLPARVHLDFFAARSASIRSRRADIPAPVVAETSKISTEGLAARAARRTRPTSNVTYGNRSVFVITSRSEVLKTSGYLSGFSSPSVTLSRATRASSPSGTSAGQTRFPTFSTRRSRVSDRSISRRTDRSRDGWMWQAECVLICRTWTPCFRIRSASISVSMSPSTTATPPFPSKRTRSASISVVFPEPGEEIRLSAKIFRAERRARIAAAASSADCRIARSTSMRTPPPGPMRVRIPHRSCPPFFLRRWYPRERTSYGSGARVPSATLGHSN